jgi:23S rRNA (uracil1939-C5)-methyltransferase
VTVDCVDLDDDGAGVSDEGAGPDAARVHVAGALPGERVVATVEHVSPHARRAWARLEAIETPSPARSPPACRAFGACGGCVLQHLDYPAQLAWKGRRLAAALRAVDNSRTLGGFPNPPAMDSARQAELRPRDWLAELTIHPCLASPRPLGYRGRSKLVPVRAGGRFVLGAYGPRSHAVVDVAGCRIARPPLDETAGALAALFDGAGVVPYDERTLTGDLRHVALQANGEGRVLAVWVSRRGLPGGAALARAFRAARPEVVGVVEHVNPERGNAIFTASGETIVLDGAGAIEERLDVDGRPLRLRLSAGAFFQANREVAGWAYGAIARGLAPEPGERAVDAYCGVGGIALVLARTAGEVVGIEAHPGAVDDARAAAALAAEDGGGGRAGVRFVAGDAARELARLDRADVVVLNPPRKGCAEPVLAEVVRLAPRAVAYLSCDPDTLARDLAWLAARGYRPREVTPLDMLPHTPHVEALALLTR